ncbi:MAG: M1 family aminopeptidase [Gemmatimonadota bacterium]
MKPFLLIAPALLLAMGAGVSPQTASPFYDLDATLDPAAHRVQVTGSLLVPLSLALDGTLVLLHSPDARDVAMSGPGILAVEAPEGEGIARYVLTLDEDATDPVRVDVSYHLTVSPTHRLNRVTPSWIELNIDSFWHPVVASIPDIRYRVRLDLGGDYELISGDRVRKVGPGIYEVENDIARRDIPFSAGRDLRKAVGDLSESWSPLPDADLEAVVAKSDSILEFLEAYTGRPQDFERPRRVVLTPREESGYSRKNYVAMSDIREMTPIDLTDYLAHEFSHYWFSGANFQTRHHWLTESFAEYVSMIFMRHSYGEAWFDHDLARKRERAEGDPTPLADFTGRPSEIALYQRGPLVLAAFEEAIGPEAFRTVIRAFIRDDIRTNEALLEMIEAELGDGARATLEHLMATV